MGEPGAGEKRFVGAGPCQGAGFHGRWCEQLLALKFFGS